MAIPDYQSLFLPLLILLKDGQAKSLKELHDELVVQYKLTPDEISRRINSGNSTFIRNRVGWARTYLHKAGLLTLPIRGHCQITDRGQQVLEEHPDKIDIAYLNRFPEFVEFRTPTKLSKADSELIPENSESTPDEQIKASSDALNKSLALDLLDAIKNNSPWFFEKLVVDLMIAMGYGGARAESGQATKSTGDNGIDGIINEDKLGLDTIYLQAKRWDNAVHRPEIDKFIGALTRQGARKGVFITTSEYSSGAREAAIGLNISIVLIDGKELAQLMIDHNIGVNIKQSYFVKDIDTDYFNED